MLNNTEIIDELSMNQESTPPAWAMFGIVLLLPGKKELGKWQNYLGARRPWSLSANKILWKVTTTKKMTKYSLNSSFKQDHDLQSKTQTARRWSREWPAAFCSAPRTAPGGWSGTQARLAVGAAPGWASLHSCSLPLKWSPKAAGGRDTVVSARTRDPLVPARVITILTVVHIYWALRRHSVFPASVRKIRLPAWLTDEEAEAEGVTGAGGQRAKEAWLRDCAPNPFKTAPLWAVACF